MPAATLAHIYRLCLNWIQAGIIREPVGGKEESSTNLMRPALVTRPQGHVSHASTTMPRPIRYQANGRYVCRETKRNTARTTTSALTNAAANPTPMAETSAPVSTEAFR